jgi:hypothetical protein
METGKRAWKKGILISGVLVLMGALALKALVQLNRCKKHFKLNKLYQLCAEKFFGGESIFYHP